MIGVFCFSFAAALIARLAGVGQAVLPLAAPGLALSVLAVIGHLVTLDEDYPGAYFNPNADRRVWRTSVAVLLGKLVVSLVLAAVVWA